MAVTIKVYSKFPLGLMQDILEESLNGSSKLKLMLTTSGYAPSQNEHQFKSDVTNEVSGTGYTAGGKTLTNVTVTQSGTTITLDADDVEWTNSTITARYGVLYYDKTGADSVKPLLCYLDFGANQSSDNDLFKIIWGSGGIISLSVA